MEIEGFQNVLTNHASAATPGWTSRLCPRWKSTPSRHLEIHPTALSLWVKYFPSRAHPLSLYLSPLHSLPQQTAYHCQFVLRSLTAFRSCAQSCHSFSRPRQKTRRFPPRSDGLCARGLQVSLLRPRRVFSRDLRSRLIVRVSSLKQQKERCTAK